MFKLSSIRTLTLTAIVAIGLACSTSATIAGGPLEKFKGVAAAEVARRDVLPPLSNPKTYRQRILVDCAHDPDLNADVCKVPLYDKIPSGRLLQVDTINCISSESYAVFTTSPKFNNTAQYLASHLIAYTTLPANALAMSMNGPFYLLSGETPTLTLGTSNLPRQAICVVSAILWKTN
jgi:hypothetical protein